MDYHIDLNTNKKNIKKNKKSNNQIEVLKIIFIKLSIKYISKY